MLVWCQRILRCFDVPKDTIACTADGKTVEELVAKRLALGNGGKTTRLNLGGGEGDRVRRELEAVGDEAGELSKILVPLSSHM